MSEAVVNNITPKYNLITNDKYKYVVENSTDEPYYISENNTYKKVKVISKSLSVADSPNRGGIISTNYTSSYPEKSSFVVQLINDDGTYGEQKTVESLYDLDEVESYGGGKRVKRVYRKKYTSTRRRKGRKNRRTRRRRSN